MIHEVITSLGESLLWDCHVVLDANATRYFIHSQEENLREQD